MEIISNGSNKINFVFLLRKNSLILYYVSGKIGKTASRKMENGLSFPNHDKLILTLILSVYLKYTSNVL